MGRFWAATRVAALFLATLFVIALFPAARASSPLAHACEACERVPLATENPRRSDVPRNLGRLDVTVAVDTATSFVIETVRGWRLFSRFGGARGEVSVAQQGLSTEFGSSAVADISDGNGVITPDEWGERLNAADYVAAYDADDTQPPARLPNFRREHRWAFTYRSDAAEAICEPAQADRFPGMNTTLDDSVVIGLHFEVEYGWTR